jgi:hypothetical protein
LLVNFLVKLGIIYGFKYKEVLVVGAIIDLASVYLVAWMGRYLR